MQQAETIRGPKWDYAGSATRTVSSLIITVVLARILGPEPFGIIAAAWLVAGVANLVADLGLGPALLQRRTISDDDIRYAFTMQASMGVLLMTVTVAAAPAIGVLFQDVKVIPVVRAMSLVFLLQTFGGIAAALLRRRMAFKTLQIARITSYFVGFVGLGIPLALFGLEVWSLVVAQLVQTILFSMFCYAQVRHPVMPLFVAPSNGLSLFGLRVLSTNLVNYLISNADTFFIARFFDVITLGLYNRVYVLVSTPMNTVVATVQQVTFSAYSRIQDNQQAVRNGYLAGFGFMTMLMVPTFGCLALVPETVIHGLFGRQWDAATAFVVPLALAMPFHAAMGTGGPMLWAKDRVGREFVAQLVTAVVLLMVLFATSRISAVALAWGVFAVTIARFFLITNAALKTLDASWRRMTFPISGSILLLMITGTVVWTVEWGLLGFQLPASRRLVLNLLAGTTAFLATTLLMPRRIFSPQMYWLVERLSDLLPVWVRPLSRRISASAAVPS